VYLHEDKILPVLDTWLYKVFAPHRIRETLHEMAAVQAASAPAGPSEPDTDAAAVIAECDAKLEKYRAALEAGVDPETVGAWITTMKAERAAALARATAERARGDPTRRLSEDDIQRIIGELSDIREVLQNANPGDKAGVYSALGLRLIYQPHNKSSGPQ
jgi:hypothetical protein